MRIYKIYTSLFLVLCLLVLFLGEKSFGQDRFVTNPDGSRSIEYGCNNWEPSPVGGGSNGGSTGGADGGGAIGGNFGPAPCVPSCGTCTPPSCPSGTDGTQRANCAAPGTSCNRGSDGCGGSCGSITRSCWYLENAAKPDAPKEIRYKLGDLSCPLGDGTRVPFETWGSGDGFLAIDGVNNRATDPIRGLAPLLRYRYRLPELNLTSSLLTTSTRYSPSLSNLVSEGGVYTIYARANSVNRCVGTTNSDEINRSFKINNVPEVISIEVVEDPNEGVSGRYDMKDVEHRFDCVVDNPKTFKVVFEDGDGCGDLWADYTADTDVCGGVKTPNLSLRAIDSVTGEVFAPQTPNELSEPYDVSCEGNQLTAYIDLTLLGDENVDLTIQAKADDIVGDTSGWQSGMDWLYDGIVPSVEIDSNIIAGADQVDVFWSSEDVIPTRAGVDLSGVRSVRISSRLMKGDVLQSDNSYGPILYEGEEIMVHESFEEWVSSLTVSASYPGELSETNRVDIGRNQDGNLDFRIESVDRACNYAQTHDSLEMGTPWIATRGGFVHSRTEIALPVKKSLYSQILPSLFNEGNGERTSLSTELVSAGNNISGFNFLGVEGHDFYSLSDYIKHSTLNRSWYPVLYNRASTRDPEGVTWSEFTAEAGGAVVLSQEELTTRCVDNRHVYFINGNLSILTNEENHYEDLAQGGNDGCIFVVGGDLIVSGGEYLSEGLEVPRYDFVRGFFLVDGEIDLEFVDGDKEVRDGLKVSGGLFATGGSKSVKLGRSLQLKDNLQYPTLIIFHDPRYLDISQELLGDTFGGGYIRDIGFKE